MNIVARDRLLIDEITQLFREIHQRLQALSDIARLAERYREENSSYKIDYMPRFGV